MSSKAVNAKLNNIINRYDNYTLIGVKYHLYPLITEIHPHVNANVYIQFTQVYNEISEQIIYGNTEEEDNIVKEQALNVIKMISQSIVV
jgi:hypothetical protein